MKEPVKLMGPTISLLHLLMLPMASTRGVALISIVNVIGDPAHPKNDGVTTKSLDTGTEEKLFAINELICPEPLAGRPLAILLLVQLKTVPG